MKKIEPIPDYLQRLLSDKINNPKFDQLIINEYTQGQKIAPHIDHIKYFDDIIYCLSIGSDINIKFELNNIVKNLLIQDNSIYIMTKDSRYLWKHSLVNNTNKTRYSLTYRKVKENL